MYAATSSPRLDDRSWVWGLPLAPLTRRQATDAVMALVESREPSYFITANAHYAMLTGSNAELQEINERAAFILADGAPLVWASRYGKKSRLPERVAGSDLIYDLCESAASRKLGVFFLGGAPGVADEAARRLEDRYPGLRVVGVEAPPFHDPSDEEHNALLDRIRQTEPDILFVAFGQPKGEFWIARNLETLGVPVAVQVGATLDFVAGRVNRAPKHIQQIGMEWAYRIWTEPRRLAPRYAKNAKFIIKMLARDARSVLARKAPRKPESLR